jgi:hypothetical protein
VYEESWGCSAGNLLHCIAWRWRQFRLGRRLGIGKALTGPRGIHMVAPSLTNTL